VSVSTTGLRRRRDLYITLVERQLRLRTKRSWLGTAWPILAPVALALLYVFVFQRVFSVPIRRYPDYLFCGLLAWAFLSTTFAKAMSSISTDPDLIRKSPLPYELLPISVVSVQALNFLATLALFLGYLGVRGHLYVAVLPIVVLPFVALFLLVAGVATLLALIDVYNHDLRQFLGNIITIWFFLVPIVYRPRMAPSGVRWLQSVDPVGRIVREFREVLFFGRVGRPSDLLLMSVACAFVFVASLVVFRRLSVNLPKDL
jgi:ABC-type polysaccharide/polyol phosphate export permease